MKGLKRIVIFILVSLFLIIIINRPNTQSTLESIATDRYVLDNQNNDIVFISTVTIKPNIDLRDDNVISKVFDEIKYFISTETTSPLGAIVIMDVESGLRLLVDKKSESIYFEDVKEFPENDCEYFILRLMKHIDWDVE